MSEAQAYIAVAFLLNGLAADQFESVRDSLDSNESGVTCWPETVQYLLRSYASATAIQQFILHLRDVRQKPDKLEDDCSARLNQACTRAGNVHSVEEKIPFFIDGFHPAIEPIMASHHEAHRNVTYLELVQFSKSQGEAIRAVMGSRRSAPRFTVPSKSAKTNPQGNFFALSSSEEFRDPSFSESRSSEKSGQVLLIDHEQDSVPTSDLPPTFGDVYADSDVFLAIGMHRGHVGAPRVPYHEYAPHMTRPGWQNRQAQRMMERAGQRPYGSIICHTCYENQYNISPGCKISRRDVWKFIKNFDRLNSEEQA